MNNSNDTKKITMSDLGKKERDELLSLDGEMRSLQAQLEGLFRQLYQSATQQSLTMSIHVSTDMLSKASVLFYDLERRNLDYQETVERLQQQIQMQQEVQVVVDTEITKKETH